MSRRIAAAVAAVTLAIVAACAPPAQPGTPSPRGGPYDVVITNGMIVDGTGAPWFYGDLAIRGDRIAAMTPRGMLAHASAKQHIDATGMVVAPGFIDIQGQTDYGFTWGDGRSVSKITQGITTEILGEGDTPGPVNARMLTDDPTMTATDRARLQPFMGVHGFGAWLDAMAKHGTGPNVGSFLGAGTVREYIDGMQQGDPTPAQLDTARLVVRTAMQDGAFGLASALIYPPGSYATTAELIEEAKAMAPFGGVYITHMRNESDRVLEAMDEAIRIGKEGGVPVEIYHMKAAGTENWDKESAMFTKIDSARAAGLDVQADMYPYTAGATGLTACLPPWTAAGGKLFANLSDPATRERIKREALTPSPDWENLCRQSTPAGVLLVQFRKPENQKWVGKRLSDVAAAMGKDWVDAAMDLILSDSSRIETIYFLMSEDNVRRQLQQPWIKIGTDAAGMDPDSARGMAHPRSYGTYPRILGRYVREQHALTLEDAIRKMTSAVADRLSVHDRGLLRPGMFADVVVFDPKTIIDVATYDKPHQISVGVEHVFVNGVEVARDEKATGALPGRVIHGPGWTGR
jgi:N-acyl-D-aspartate/D-glutamate deacylase